MGLVCWSRCNGPPKKPCLEFKATASVEPEALRRSFAVHRAKRLQARRGFQRARTTPGCHVLDPSRHRSRSCPNRADAGLTDVRPFCLKDFNLRESAQYGEGFLGGPCFAFQGLARDRFQVARA